MDLNRLNLTQYMWIITKTNKPLGMAVTTTCVGGYGFYIHSLSNFIHGSTLDLTR
jgi:hypothetical protein